MARRSCSSSSICPSTTWTSPRGMDGKVLLAGNRIQFHKDAPIVQQVAEGELRFSGARLLQGVKGQALGGAVDFAGGMDVSACLQAPTTAAVDMRASGIATAEGFAAGLAGPTFDWPGLAQGKRRTRCASAWRAKRRAGRCEKRFARHGTEPARAF